MRSISCALGVAACLISTRADADVSKAWAAAKDNLPAAARFVATLDVAAVTKLSSFTKVFDALRAAERDLDIGYTLMKGACGFDPVTAVDGVVIAGDPLGRGVGVAYLQLTVDRAKASACLEAALKVIERKKQITVKQDGIYTVATAGKESVYFAWVAPNVVAVSIEPDKKATLDAWINSKGFAKSPLGALVKFDAKALATGAFALDKPVNAWLPITKGMGSLHLAGGNVTAAGWITVVDAKTAKSLVDDVTKDIQKDLNKDRTPPAIKKIMSAIKLTAKGADVVIDGKAAEKDIGEALLQMVTKSKKKDEATPPRAAEPPPPAKP